MKKIYVCVEDKKAFRVIFFHTRLFFVVSFSSFHPPPHAPCVAFFQY